MKKDVKRQPATFAEGNFNNFKPILFQKFSRMKVILHCIILGKKKFGPLNKG
jgi:hypothetical protein